MPFLGVPARPGEIIRERVPVGELLDGTPITLPVVTIRGTSDGPTFYLQAGLHGDEQTGIEVARLVLQEIDPRRISGTVVCVPLANVPAHLTRTRGFLHEERWLIDINRSFPGNPHGLLSERIGNVLFEEFTRHADLTMDLHSALDGCDIAPFSYVDPDDDQAGTLELRERVARSLGTPYIYYKSRAAKLGTSDMSRSLAAQADTIKKAAMIVEMGESRRVSHNVVPIGIRAVHNAMKILGIEPGEPEVPGEPRRFSQITPVHINHGGGLRMRVDLGDDVKEGDTIAEVVDVFGQTVEKVTSPIDGFVLRAMRLGAAHTGAEVAWIVR